MIRQLISAALSASALIAVAPGAATAQNYPPPGYGQGYGPGPGPGQGPGFWQGAPEGPRERIDWLQRRIQRGVSDGSLDPREANRSQTELNNIRRTAYRLSARDGGMLSPPDRDMIQSRLDDLSRRIRWREGRAPNGYGAAGYGPPGYGGQPGYQTPPPPPPPGGPDRFATNYDAARDYRDDPRYQERRLSSEGQVYRGSDGRYYCKRNDGTTGLIVGAVGGGVLGNVIEGGRNRVAGTLIGGALGALAGKAIDQSSDIRCR